jgi:hypothetical protein
MSTPASNPDPKARKAAALAAATMWLGAVYGKDGWNSLADALADALRSGTAEGEASALAAAAAAQGVSSFAIGRAFQDAYDRLAGDLAISQQASDLAQKIVAGAAADISLKLAAMSAQGDSEDGISDAVHDTVSGTAVRSVGSWLSEALWTAAGMGALALYSRASQQQPDAQILVDWITESGNPCVICQGNEAGSPYAPADVPSYLAHPNCRCELSSDSYLPSSLFSAYVLS